MILVSVLYVPFVWRREGVCLILTWAAWCRSHGTDTSLTQCLTKINRMDIVHLMETSGIDPVQGHGTRVYTDTEQSLALDHSEGKCLLTQTARGTSLSITVLQSVGPDSVIWHLSALVTEHRNPILKAQCGRMQARHHKSHISPGRRSVL